MDRENFCDRVLSRVRHATPEERTAIRSELLGHLEDHAEALKEAGYDEETAGERALSAMGEPERIGEELNRNYPLGWLILSRVTLAASIFLAVSVFFYWPLLGNTVSSFQARIDPEGSGYSIAEEPLATTEAVNLKTRIGDDVLRVYQVSLMPADDGQTGTVSIAICNYDRNPFGTASGVVLNTLRLETESGETVPQHFRSGGGNSGAYYGVVKGVPVTRQDGYLAVIYDRYGSDARLEVPLDWEGAK